MKHRAEELRAERGAARRRTTFRRSGKDVMCFLQAAAKFDARYATLGFNDRARLDDGDMWPVSFAIVRWTDAVQERVEDLVRRAAG